MGLFSSSKKKSHDSDSLDGLQKKYVNGHAVYFARNAHKGIYYLDRDLQNNESDVFFNQARRHYSREAQFEDDADREYTLFYIGNRKYKLERR